MFLFKKSRSSNNHKFGLAALAASSAALLALATPAAANPLNFNRKFIAPDGASSDYFGRSVALDGDYALIGSYGDDDNGVNSGSAYLFDSSTGDFLQKFIAPDGASSDYFGRSVAIYGNQALIGSVGDDDNGSLSGSAYLFDLTSGNLLQKFIAPDGVSNDRFGLSVAIDGNQALIGSYLDDDKGSASGSAYLFDSTTGDLIQKIVAPDAASGDWFGYSVALDGDYALIGSYYDDDNGADSGSAYLFDTTSGSFLQKLTAPDGASSDNFGRSVALDGDYALIGSYYDDDNGLGSGSAYLFDTTTGSFLQKILAPDGASYDYFGYSVALDGEYALIGSLLDDDNGYKSGSAYLFDTTAGDLIQKIIAPDGASYDHFGNSVALDGGRALIGSVFGDDKGTDSGSAYLFVIERVPEPSVVIGLVAIVTLAAFKRSSRQQKQ